MADKTINLYHTNSNVNIPVKMVDNGDGTFAQQFSAIAGGAGDKIVNLYHDNANVAIPVLMADQGDGTFAQRISVVGGGGGLTDPTTTKGDLIVHGTTTTRLGVGADNTVLTADSSQTLGVKWGAGGTAAAGSLTGATLAANVLASSLTSVGILASPHMTSVVVDSGGLAVTAGVVTLGDTASRIVPGATSFSVRNTANSADNLLITDAGGATFRSGQTVTATTFSGALSGNASTATALATARAINGTNFDGSAPITVTADASTLTGTVLKSTVVTSSLTSVGVLAAPHLTSAVIDSGGLTITTGSLVVSAGSANSIVGVATSGGATLLTLTPGAHTNVTAEASNVVYTGVTQTITGGYATQRFIQLGQPTISAATSLTVTTAATFAIAGAPIAAGAGPAVITTPLALWVQAGTTRLDGGLTFGAAANVVAISNTASALQFTDGTNAYHTIDTRTTVTGVVAHSLTATGPTIASASGVTYSVVSIPAVTTTLTGVTTVTALNGLALNIARPTVTDASAATVTTLSTVYIAGAPIAAGSATLTTALALHVAQGMTLLTGPVNTSRSVGSWTPALLLDNPTTSTYNGIEFRIVGTARAGIYADTGSQLNFASNGGWLFCSTSGTTRATIDASGNGTFASLTLNDAGNVIVGSTTGTRIGTATTQKLSIWNASPIVQPSAVGSATGFAAGTTAVTFHSDDTYTGNVGSTGYTLNGVVAALKTFGLLAA